MRGFGRTLRCAVALTVLLVMLLGFSAVALADDSAIKKEEKSYEIAVAYDNSGSMYGSPAWCRAKYAMEIFASMLDYGKGDRLVVFPMWEVLTDGSQSGKGSYAPIQITSEKDIDKIHNMFTLAAGETPFAPVTEAFRYLQGVSGKERWLIVLTDGAFNQRDRDAYEGIDVQGELDALAGGQINIQYLGFSGAKSIRQDPSRGLYATMSNETSLQQDLVKICNQIFRRSELPASYLQGNTLTLDLSMGKLIVFAQGRNARIDSLKDSSGREIRKTMDPGQRTYSTLSAGDSYSRYAPVDDSLAGQVVTFANCTAGTYTLSYSDADNIQIFYEPDVDLSTQFLNADGTMVDTSSGEIVSGDYMVRYGLVDRVTGELVTDHPLLAVKDFKCDVIIDGGQEVSVQNGETITLEPETEISFRYSGTFLGDYTISAGGQANTMKLKVLAPAVSQVEVELTADQTWYVKRTYGEWKPLTAKFKINGVDMTEAQIQSLVAVVESEPEMPLQVVWPKGEPGCQIHICRDDQGEYVEGDVGRFKIKIQGTYIDEYGREIPFSDSASIKIDENEPIVVLLWWILIVLAVLTALAILYWLIGLIKKLPKRVQLETTDSKSGRKIGRVTIHLMKKGSSTLVKDRITAKAVVPETGYHKRKKSTATFLVKGISVSSKVTAFTIGGKSYTRNRNKAIIGSSGTEVNPDSLEFSVYDGMKISWTAVDSSNKKYSYVGEILINRK